MYCLSDVPAEIWTLIFGYLNLEDLVDVETACTPLVGSISQQVASSVISSIIAHGTLVAAATDDCPNLPEKQQQQRFQNGLKLVPFIHFPLSSPSLPIVLPLFSNCR